MKSLAFVVAVLFAVSAYAEPPQKSEKGKAGHKVQKSEQSDRDCPREKAEQRKSGPRESVERGHHGPPWMQHGQRPMMQQRSGQQHRQSFRGGPGGPPMMQHRGMHRGGPHHRGMQSRETQGRHRGMQSRGYGRGLESKGKGRGLRHSR